MDSKPITRRRGDTYRIRIEFSQDDDTPLPLDGTFRLVVTEQSAPADDDVPVMELVGSIVGAAADGILDFPLTAIDADNVGEFYYEVENTTSAGDVRTILEGPFTMIQDRAKTPLYSWTADGATATDGSEGVYAVKMHANDTLTFTTRDGTPILRFGFDKNDNSRPRFLFFPDFPSLDFSRKFRITVLCYMDSSWYVDCAMNLGGFDMRMDLTWENEPGYRDVGVFGTIPDEATQVQTTYSESTDHNEWTSGWIQTVFEWEPTAPNVGTWKYRGFQPPAADPETWDGQEIGVHWPLGFLRFYLGLMTLGIANAEIATVELEYLRT